MNEIRLSTKQKEIVEAPDGPMLVLASAGSGKTRVLTERIRFLLTTKPGSFRVLALTFTNKAAEEMQTRLKNVTQVNERAFIGTIHKFCLEIIRSKGPSIGLNEMPHIFERENDRLEILTEVFSTNPVFKKYLDEIPEKDRTKYLFSILNYISQKKKNLLSSSPYGIELDEDEDNIQLFNEYNAVLRSQNAIDFDDVIYIAYKIIIERPKVAELYRKMYKYICVDEAQDLNFAQYEFIKVLCGNDNRNVLMVGDPNQAIYGFNGSDKVFMTKLFVDDFSAFEISLNENYRSSKIVLETANKLVPGSVDFNTAVIPGEFQIVDCKNEFDEAEWIASKIEYFLSRKHHRDIENEIGPESMAVLARNKYVFGQLEKVLITKQVPFYYKKTNDLSDYESDLVKSYDLGIRVLVNPLDTLHLQQLYKLLKIQFSKIIGGATGIDRLEQISVQILDPEIRSDFDILVIAWKMIDANINHFLRALTSIEKYVQQSASYSRIPNKKFLVIKDLQEMVSMWKQYSLQSQTDSKSIANFRNQVALGITSSKNSKANGVMLGTVHSAKGLEFDIVFVMGMSDGTFPDYRAVREGQKALSEEKNNVFVAITRSRRLLFLTYPRQKFMPWDKDVPVEQSPSRFIQNLA